ncbi:MAG: oligosaccharide flippase family protein [Bacteroidales bacterium]|nr:oligosaccharide flippase family protein [Bacteroidales bacterium]
MIKSAEKKGFFHLFLANALIQLFGFGSQFLVAWFLDVEELGQIKIIQTYFSVAVMFSTFGFNTSVLKLCSESRPYGQKIYLYRKALQYAVIAICIVLPIVVIATQSGLISSDLKVQKYFLYVLFALGPSTLDNIFSSYLQSQKKFKLLSRINISTKILSVICIIIFTWLYRFDGYIIGYILGFLFSFLMLTIGIKKTNFGSLPEQVNKPFKNHTRYSIWALVVNMIGLIGSYTDVFLMNYLIVDKEAIGFYSFALTILLVMTMFRSTVCQFIVPYFSEKSNDIIQLQIVSKKYELINIVSTTIIAIALFFLVPPLVKLFFGNKFLESIPLFRILIWGEVFYSVINFKGYTMLGLGAIKSNFITSAISVTSGFVITYLFVQNLGIQGLAYGKVINSFISIFIVNIVYRITINQYRKK